MKTHNAALAKRRWTCFNFTVPVVVFWSLVGTASVLLGLHTRFPTGYNNADNSSLDNRFENAVKVEGGKENDMKVDDWRINELVDKFKPNLPQVLDGYLFHKRKTSTTDAKPGDINSKDPPRSHDVSTGTSSVTTSGDDGKGGTKKFLEGLTGDATDKSCQLRFGSYCFWSTEHKEVMKDSLVKILKDQLFVARAYYASTTKLNGEKLLRDMKQNIQEYEHILNEAVSDPELPLSVQKKIEKMDQIIAKAKTCPVDCNNVDKKLRQILYLTEDETHFHMKQSAFLHHLGMQTIPKNHHCLFMRLTVEYFRAPLVNMEPSHAHKLDNPSYQQYIIFSWNVLAVSVTINSTVSNSQEPGNMVFNVLTDKQNFYAMELWFSRNSYNEAVVHVLNVEDLDLNISYGVSLPQLSPSEEFRISIRTHDKPSTAQIRIEYISLFGHSHFLIPEIFKNLRKVVVLDDDVVLQRDLSSLWDIDLLGKVNGAMEFCSVRLSHLQSYLGNNQNTDSCAWMSGLNVIDLEKWRKVNITGMYQQALYQFHNGSEASWRAAALPTSLLSFQDHIFPLDNSWVLSGLGYDYRIETDAVQNAGVLHYNGNMKPWLDLGIPKYKNYWKKFLKQGELFMDQCKVNQ